MELRLAERTNSNARRQKKQFRYELMWESHTGFHDTLSQAWESQPLVLDLEGLQKKMVAISKHLGEWETSTFGSVKRELKGLKEDLERLRSDSHRLGPSHEEIKIAGIVELNHREEVMWKQCSRVTWLTEEI